MRRYGMNFPELCNAGFTNKILDSDENYQYIAYAECGTPPEDPNWAVKRISLATGSVDWAGGTNDTVHVATDLLSLFA